MKMPIMPLCLYAFMRVGEDPANSNVADAAAYRAGLARLKALLKEVFP
ncbi:hypothetical protein [Acidipila sp. EB88]|nr:hypothetical protein [Acidipila sp. EB88]